jgi:hypothetical protein
MLASRPTPSPADASWAGYFFVAARFVAGYIAAVAAGAIVFAAVAHVVPAMPFLPDPIEGDPLLSVGQTAFMYFILGLVFGIPYTVVGGLAVKFWLPWTPLSFLAVGMLCPASAVLLVLALLGGVSVDWKMLELLLVTLPAGLAAAYIFGAVGFGRGFGRWRTG